jgi:tetratricopeptide (TPR) repeat protein
MDATPATIGKYRILRVLGRGGMGTVYEALDPLINRKVAVKTMIPGLADNPELRERFMREAQSAGGLRHRNIVTVYDLWEDFGQPYIAMEFIEGSDLERLMQQQPPLGLERKLDIIRQVCEGLGYAHKSGIVHRDVKPANIRVTPEGEVKIMDFGIAHLQSSTMTKSGLVLGTVHYMAPEQLAGEKVDHRADVFSVGVIAYELLSGRKPFDGESLTTVMYKIIHDDADPRALPRTLYSPRLDAVVMRALARRMDQRYPSLDEMHADLQGLVREAAAREQAARADEQALRQRVEREIREIRAAARQARGDGQLQKALGFVRRLREIDPDDAEAAREAGEIEAAIHDREVEQLCGTALSYAAEGETDLARRIAARIETLAPRSPRYLKLRSYLEEEHARRTADALTATAQEHLALGNLVEARAAAEEALGALPSHALAREIRERATAILAVQERHVEPVEPAPAEADTDDATVMLARPRQEIDAEATVAIARPERPRVEAPLPAPVPPAALPEPPAAPPLPTPPAPTAFPAPAAPAVARPARRDDKPRSDETRPLALSELRPVAAPPPVAPAAPAPPRAPLPPSPAPAAALQLTPLPEGTPGNPEAARLLDSARLLLRERQPSKALPLLEQAQALEPSHPGIERLLGATRSESRRAEIEALTTAALDHFVANRYAKARQAVQKALALDPGNRKAKDLLKILGPLG